MSRMGDAGITASLKELRDIIKQISKDVNDIKEMLGVTKQSDEGMYPWHLPNVNTTLDVEDSNGKS